MKTKFFLSGVIFILFSLVSIHVGAQTRLNAMVKKCETMNNVDIDIIRDKDKETKKTYKVIRNITFSDNKALLDEIIQAFEQDKENAHKTIETKKYGRIIPTYCRFEDENTDYTFTLSVKNEGKGATFTVIERYDN